MTVTVAKRPGVGSRRFGYLMTIVVDAVLLYAANRRPGWEALPFLTRQTVLVLGSVNAALVVSLAVNVVYLFRDPRWLKALGDMLTLAVGVVALVRIWQVFPFDFGHRAVDWVLVARVALGIGILGGALGILASLVTFVRSLTSRSRWDRA